MTPRERAEEMAAIVPNDRFTREYLVNRIEQTILADRQALQSEIAQAFCGGFRIVADDPPTVEAIKSRIDWLERRVTELEQENGHLLRGALKMIPSSADPDRISALHQIIGQQAETIRQLKEENRVLRESLAHFEHLVPDYHPGEGPTDRKA